MFQRKKTQPVIDWDLIVAELNMQAGIKHVYEDPPLSIYTLPVPAGEGVDGECFLEIRLNRSRNSVRFANLMSTGPHSHVRASGGGFDVLPAQEQNAAYIISTAAKRPLVARNDFRFGAFVARPLPRPLGDLVKELKIHLGNMVNWNKDGMSGYVDHFLHPEVRIKFFIYTDGEIDAVGNIEVLEPGKIWVKQWNLGLNPPEEIAEAMRSMIIGKPDARRRIVRKRSEV